MNINKQLFEDVLSGKLKGRFVLRNGNRISTSNLKRNVNGCVNIYPYINRCVNIYPYRTVDHSYSVCGRAYVTSLSNYDIVDFIPDTNMKESELTIEIPEGKIVDWDESKKQNKIVLKDKQLTYEEMCDKLFPKSGTYYFVNNHGNISTASSMCNPYISNPNSATTAHQLACLLAKNKLANVAKYLNDGWKPDKGDHIFAITYAPGNFDNEPIVVEYYFGTGENLVLFQTQKKAKQAIEILGEETVKLALEPLGI